MDFEEQKMQSPQGMPPDALGGAPQPVISQPDPLTIAQPNAIPA